jgi:hypothetical protein
MIDYEDLSFEQLTILADERLKALICFDLDYARKMMPELTEEVRILGMHKARYLCNAVPSELRHQSAEFLRSGNHTSNGLEILPEGELPN